MANEMILEDKDVELANENYLFGDVSVEYDYNPEERPERESGYPGCPESVELIAIKIKVDDSEEWKDISDEISNDEKEILEEKALEHYHDYMEARYFI